MKQLKFRYEYAVPFIRQEELEVLAPYVALAHEQLQRRTGAGSDFLGWLDLPNNFDREELARIKAAAAKIKSDSDVLIVIGIGGSYLGARAAMEMLSHSFYNLLPQEERKTPQVFFAGQAISGRYLQDLMEVVRDKDFSINVISKSGTTTEPALAFRAFNLLLE